MRDKAKPLWEIAREWAAFAFSALAIIISVFTAYFTTFRTLDELKVVIDRRPVLFMWTDRQNLMTYGSLSILFINSGNRPISVLGTTLYFGQTKEVDGRVRCEGVEIDTDFDSLVIDEKKVILSKLGLKLPMILTEGEDLKEDDGFFTFNAAPSLARGSISMCVGFRLATPLNEVTDVFVEIERQTVVTDKPHDTLLSNRAPILVWRQSGTIFGGR